MEELYTWDHVVAYSIIALNNLLNSANDINLKNLEMVIEPLQTIHTKNSVIVYANKLIAHENK